MTPGRWSKGTKSHSQESRINDPPTLVGQGGVRAGEEGEFSGLAWLNAKVLWNGLRGPSTPRIVISRTEEGASGGRNATQDHGKSMGPGSDLDPPGLAVCSWAKQATTLSLGFLMSVWGQYLPKGLGQGVRERG